MNTVDQRKAGPIRLTTDPGRPESLD